jgi:tyrosyl-tRNA synthetase
LLTIQEIERNKRAIADQYRQIYGGKSFKLVDNYSWFKDMHYLSLLREVGKHVPLRQMLSRDFIQSRLGETGAGISYAEFSYVLIQAYDFLQLYEKEHVTLQVCGSDQWGNSIAGVDLIRRKTGGEAHVYSVPLITNKSTGRKFGKSEEGAVWLDPAKTTPTQFYQFWINADDAGVEDYLKIFTELDKSQIESVMAEHQQNPGARLAQTRLAEEVTTLIHGSKTAATARQVTEVLIGKVPVGETDLVGNLRAEIAHTKASDTGSILTALVETNLAPSNSEARRLLAANAISINGVKVNREQFEVADFQHGRLLLRRGKAFKDTALVELG